MGRIALVLGIVAATFGEAEAAPSIVAGRILLQTEDAAAVAKRYDLKVEHLRALPRGWSLWATFTAAGEPLDEGETRRLVERLREDPDAPRASAEHRYALRAVPDDDELAQQWSLDAVGAPAAWDATTGSSMIRVGVLDSGLSRDHRDLRDKDLTGYDFISDPTIALDDDGRDDDYEDDFDEADCGGTTVEGRYHGTAVAGVILASSDNGRGIAGLDWNAMLVTARVAGACGVAVTSDVLDAATWLSGATVDGVPDLGADSASVINLSVGRPGACSPAERDVFAAIAARGVAVVASAGGDPTEAPANCEGVVAVGATTRDGNIAPYSANAGVDVFAPGGAIVPDEQNGILAPIGTGRNDYAYFDGTSLAAAHVSGAFALLLASDPSATPDRMLRAIRTSGSPCAGCSAPSLRIDAAIDALVNTPPVALEGEPCDASRACAEALICAADKSSERRCRRACDTASGLGCEATEHCLPVPNLLGAAACIEAGTARVGSPCVHASDCVVQAVCVSDEARTGLVCRAACHQGFACAPEQSCVALNPYQSYCVDPPPPEPMTPAPPPPTVEPPPASTGCLLSRGIHDCDDGEGCIDDGDDDDVGFCAAWSGTRAGGERCDSRFDCAFGLCERGVCLFGCTEGACVAGYTCDAAVMDGGLCRPNDCAGSSTLCGSGYSCEAIEEGTVCARSAGGCTATHGRSHGGWWWLLLLTPLLRRSNP